MEVCEPLERSENSKDMVWLEPKAHREIQKELFWGWAPDARARLEDFLRGQRRRACSELWLRKVSSLRHFLRCQSQHL